MCPNDDKNIAKLPVKKSTLRKFDVETDSNTKEVLDFVRRFQIQPGDTPIEAMRIYLKYKYSKDPRTFKLNFKNFFTRFSKFFKKKRRKNGIVYFLNKESFDLTDEGYWQYRNRLRNEKKRQEKEKKEN